MSHLWQVKIKTGFFGTAPSIGRKGTTRFFETQRHLLDVKTQHAFL
jgi:hypothetical protein